MSPPISLDLNSSCRLCLSQEGLLPLFSDIESDEEISNSLPRKILACVAIEVSPESNFPKNICEVCKKSIDDWEKFKEQCERVNSTLHQFVDSRTSADYVENIIGGGGNDIIKWQAPLSPSLNIGDQGSEGNVRADQRRLTETEKLNTMLEDTEIQNVRVQKVIFEEVTTMMEIGEKIETFNDCSENDDLSVESSSNCHQKNKYVCGVNNCEKSFTMFAHLIDHDINEHSDLHFEVACEFCDRMFLSQDRLQIHTNSFHSEKKLPCDLCGEKFTSKSTLLTHKVRHSGRFTCVHCGLTANSNSALVEHIRKHTDERPFDCDICDKKFKSKNNLRAHMRSHSKLPQFKCSTCGKLFTDWSTMHRHKKIHSTDKPFTCELCGKCFPLLSRLNEHKKFHTDSKNYACKTCNKTFKTSFQRNRHSRVHENEKNVGYFECSTCHQRFRIPEIYESHLQTHLVEKNETPVDTAIEAKNINEDNKKCDWKKYLLCHVCQKKFLKPEILRCHLRTHTTVYSDDDFVLLTQI
ncbi:hypothetical protein LSTR_LSTR002390 [Laodelphax striatellus]|uniref:Protein krueppel n=1 Tax=Laodelphax striatellus TaxID=195883 RepID=A0A482X280_LAOST|nr:hypothetical protein LSTR_LSTR002390 [Laodelphax striatellus]